MAQFRKKAKTPAPLYAYSAEQLAALQAHWNDKLARTGLSVDAGKPPLRKRAWKLIRKASRGQ